MHLSESGTAPAAERGRDRVLIGVSSKSIGFLDPWVAHEKGFFRKYGIESEVITIRPNLSVVALHAGEIDYSWMTGTVIRAAAKRYSAQTGYDRAQVIFSHASGAAEFSVDNRASRQEDRDLEYRRHRRSWSRALCSKKPA